MEVHSTSEDSEERLQRHRGDAPIQDFIARDSDATSASEGARPLAGWHRFPHPCEHVWPTRSCVLCINVSTDCKWWHSTPMACMASE